MIICQCEGLNEATVIAVLDSLDTTATVAAVTQACGAGGDCESCVPLIETLIFRRGSVQGGEAEHSDTRAGSAF